MGDWVRKNDNVEAVAEQALKFAEAAPEEPSSPDQAEPSPDWINAFTRAAEDASSDDLRERLARILAGEIRKPGSYSKATVRLVAELDKYVLDAFSGFLDHIIGGCIPLEDNMNTGPAYQHGIVLQNSGLVFGVGGTTSKQLSLNQGNGIFGSPYGVGLVGQVGHVVTFPVWILTQPGLEIAGLLMRGDPWIAPRRLANLIDKSGLTRVMIGLVYPLEAGRSHLAPTETIWEAPGSC